MGMLTVESDIALLIVAASGLLVTLLAIVRDTRDRRRSLGSALS